MTKEQRDKKNQYNNIWIKKNRPKINVYMKRYLQNLRQKLFTKYGHECSKCGFDDERALQLDHVKGNGSKETKKLGALGVYRKALKARKGTYQILCANCNWIKRSESAVEKLSVGVRPKMI